LIAVTLLGGEFEPPAGNVDRIAEVMGDDAGELVETIPLAGEFVLTGFELLQLVDPGEGLGDGVGPQLDALGVGLAERVRLRRADV